MKRVDRSVVFLTLSALDTLATAIGVFVLLVAFLMPYYQNSFDLETTLAEARVGHETTAAELDDVKKRIAEDSAKANELLAEASQVSAKAASLEARAVPRPPKRPPAAPAGETVVQELDLVFIIDTTASMTPVLIQLTRSMASLVRILEQLVPSVRIGVVAYRDYDSEPPLIRTLPLTGTRQALDEILSFVASLRASRVPSGDLQEAVYLGITTAGALSLRPSARQALVVIGDAATHYNEQAECLEYVRHFVAGSAKRTLSALFTETMSSLAFGNIDRAFLVQLAAAGNGNFTDHAASMTESILLSVLVEHQYTQAGTLGQEVRAGTAPSGREASTQLHGGPAK